MAEFKEHSDTHHDLLFFRGGYAQATYSRNNELFIGNPLLNKDVYRKTVARAGMLAPDSIIG